MTGFYVLIIAGDSSHTSEQQIKNSSTKFPTQCR